jgi:hypothetical protein
MADKVIYWSKTALTGGGATALDSIDGAGLKDGEVAHVWVSNVLYIYLLDVDSAAPESSPAIIAPDTNAGDKRWRLQSYYSGSGTLYTDHIAESTAGHGVEIDGVTLKDGGFAIGSDADGDMYYRASGALARYASGKTALDSAIRGDGTPGRVLRISTILVEDGTDAAHIKATMQSRWNGDTHAVVDNIGKDDVVTGSYWSLNAAGTQLTLVAAGITGVFVFPLPITVIYNTTGTAISCYGVNSAGNILLSFYNAANGAPQDIAALVDTNKQFTIVMAYITSG